MRLNFIGIESTQLAKDLNQFISRLKLSAVDPPEVDSIETVTQRKMSDSEPSHDSTVSSPREVILRNWCDFFGSKLSFLIFSSFEWRRFSQKQCPIQLTAQDALPVNGSIQLTSQVLCSGIDSTHCSNGF